MKKNFKWKRIGAVLLAAAMSLSMGMTALADVTEPTAADPVTAKNGTLTIQGTSEIPKTGAEFTIYPVLTFLDAQQLSTGEYVFTNITVDDNSPFKGIIDGESFGSKTGLEAVAEYPDQSGANVPSSQIAQFAARLAAVSDAATPEASVTIGASGASAAVTVPYGYYLVLETKAPDTDTYIGVKSAPMLVAVPQIQGTAIAEDVKITVKSSTADIDKEIVDESGNGADVNNGAVGDSVNYKVTSDIPLYGADVTEFHYVITDTLSKGLTYQDDMKISLWLEGTKEADLLGNGASVFDGAVSTGTDNNGDMIITVDLENYLTKEAGNANKAVYKYAEDGKAQLVLEYSAKINADAVQGDGGNENGVHLEYETGHKTDEHTVSTYTTSLLLIKEEQSSTGTVTGTPLAGAEFKLSKKNGENYEALKDGNGDPLVLTTDTEGKLSFPGLSEGEYELEETKAPSGYNLDSTKRYFTLTFDAGAKKWSAAGTENVIVLKQAEGGPEGTFETTITNVKGMALPGTGGMGTTIFKTAGGAIILLACVMLLIYYKKKNHSNSQQ